jgi:hypothetical protein
MIRHGIVRSFVLAALAGACVVSNAPPASGPPPAPAAGSMEPGVNRNGNDIQNMDLPSPDPALCGAECDKNAQCVAWTYVKPGIQGPNARCWLKNPVPEPHPDDCCTSGVK